MKKAILICCMLIAVLSISAIAEVIEFGNWELAYYVDEFKLPTNEAYIVNSTPIEGTFCNSAVDDAHLKVSFLLDKFDLAFVLYEYGDNKVKNSFPSECYYDVTMLDDAREKTYMTGIMSASGDRILFDSNDASVILNALRTNSVLSFYIAETNNPTTNYLFTISDTSGINKAILSLEESINEVDYQTAVKLYNSGEYQDALAAFATLGNYKDSAEWEGKYQAMKYAEAETLLATGNYAEANDAFIKAGSFSDAKQRIGEPYYVMAEMLLASGDYAKANNAFIEAGSYSDAKQRIGEPYYVMAEVLLASGDYAKANNAFIEAGSYSDAKQRIGEPYYVMAETLFEQGKYEEANNAFTLAGKYSDAQQRILEVYYFWAESLLANKNYEAANEAFISAGNYNDAKQRIGESYYIQAEELLASKKYEEANAAFIAAKGYRDAAQRIGEPYYVYAELLFNEGKYAEAKLVYLNAREYGNAEDMAKECTYREAYALLENGKYGESVITFQSIAGYKDTSSLLKTNNHLSGAAKRMSFSKIGNIVTLGEYEQDGKTSNGKEPIEWIVVQNQSETSVLLLSRYVLDVKQMHHDENGVLWKNSDLRKWLNNEFYNEVFTQDEQACIALTSLQNKINKSGDTEHTEDYVFFLSTEETKPYAETDLIFKMEVTPAAFSDEGYSSWWTRTPAFAYKGDSNRSFFTINRRYGGIVEYGSHNGADSTAYIRPAICIDLNSLGILDEKDRIPYETLQQGDKNDKVKKLQAKLVSLGALSSKVDGDYGKMTAAAVSQMQEAWGMEVTGIADDAFQLKLYENK